MTREPLPDPAWSSQKIVTLAGAVVLIVVIVLVAMSMSRKPPPVDPAYIIPPHDASGRDLPNLTNIIWAVTPQPAAPTSGLAKNQTRPVPTLTLIAPGNRFQGFTGCRQITGTYQLNGQSLTLANIAPAATPCTQHGEIETSFIAVLKATSQWAVSYKGPALLEANDKNAGNAARAAVNPAMVFLKVARPEGFEPQTS